AISWQLLHKPADITVKAHLSEIAGNLKISLIRFVFAIAILPFEAFQYADAILRTAWRMRVTRRRLMEWTPFASHSGNRRGSLWSTYQFMPIGPLLALGCAAFLLTNLQDLLVASPILFLWLLSPAVVWRLSKPETEPSPKLNTEELSFLHKTARKTWAFFEQFVTADDNWLPPDNFQEYEGPVIAHRTSPTNMGLSLLANLAAYDFAYLSGTELMNRCALTLKTMNKLERYKGHFCNWYDTRSLSTLHPRYVSTVDSGNLVGHLLTLRQGLLAIPGQPIFTDKVLEGFNTTVTIISGESKGRFD